MISQFFLEFLQLNAHRVHTKVTTFLKSVTRFLRKERRARHRYRQADLLVLSSSRLDNLALHLHLLDIFKCFLQLGDLLFDERL